MARPPSLVQLAFANGFDESIEEEILDPSKAYALLENGRQDRRGGYTKRLGFAALNVTRFDGTTRTAGNRMLVHDDLVSVIDGTYLDTYSETKSVNVVASRVPEASVSVRTLAAIDSDSVFDIVHCNGYIATACLVSSANQLVAVSVETKDGVVVRAPETVFTGSTSTVIASLTTYSTYMILLAMSSNSANIAAYYLDTTSTATVTTGWVSIGNVATDKIASASTTAARNCSSQSLTSGIAFGYVNNSGGTSQVTVKRITIAGVADSTTVNTASATPDVVAIEGLPTDTLWVCWNETTSCRLKGLDPASLASVKASAATLWTYTTTPIRPAHPVSDPSTAGAGRVIGPDIDGTTIYYSSRVAAFTTAASAVVLGSTANILGGTYINRPFMFNGRYYAIAALGSITGSYTSSAIIADWTDAFTTPWFRPVANPFADVSQIVTTAGKALAHHWAIDSTTVGVVVTVQRSSAAYSAYLVTLDFADIGRWQTAAHNGSTFLSGGILSYFDGRRVAEASFLYAPDFVITSTPAGVLTGAYSWVCTYEEVDNDGNWNISSVSSPRTSTPAAKSIVFTFRNLAVTARLTATPDPRVRVSVYRTLVGGAAPYYYVGSLPHVSTTMTFTDNLSDSTISTNRLLLGTGNLPGTNGGAQDRRAPPYATGAVSYQGMLVVASGPNLYWSGQTVIGEGTWWNPAFVTTTDGGDITAIEAMDGTVYAFGARTIHATSGEAPADNGSSGGLGNPRRIAVDVGSIDGHTLVTELGIWFRSHRGIELLGRGGGVTWVGEGVQKTLASYPNVTSMVLDEKESLVRISLAAATSGGRASGQGRTVVYDLTLQTWISRDDVRGSSAHEAAQDACIVTLAGEQRYAWLGVDGIVHYEKLSTDSDAYLDGSTWIAKRATTPAFKQAGIQGMQQLNRVQVLERKSTDHDLGVALAYNHEQTFRTATNYSAATINSLLAVGYPITQLRHDPHNDAECQAVAIDILDATPTSGTVGSGEGGTWLALTLDITPAPGIFEVPEGAS